MQKSVLAVILMLLIPSAAAVASEPPARKHILYVNSYHEGYPWSDDISKGIKEAFLPHKDSIELYIEYLDTKRFGASHIQEYFDLLMREKYSNTVFSLILVSDDNAFQTLLWYCDQNQITNIPIVFCGVNNYVPEQVALYPNVTGIVEKIDYAGCANLARWLNPELKKLAIIVDNTASGKGHRKIATEDFSTFSDVRPIWLDGHELSMQELISRVQQLDPEDTAVLMSVWLRDKNNQYFSVKDGFTAISKACKVPFYGAIDQGFEYGILGGYVISGITQGREAARIGLELLNGKPVSDFPVNTEGIKENIFNWPEMERWGITLNDIPEGSKVLNQPQSFYHKHKTEVWTIALFLVAQSGIIAILAVNINHRRRIEKQLRNHEEKLEQTIAKRTRDLEQALIEAQSADRAKSDFLANMSHEIRTPMTAIVGHAELLIEESQQHDQHNSSAHSVRTILEQSHHLWNIMNDILDLSKVEAGKMSVEKVSCSLPRILANVYSLMKIKAEEKQLWLAITAINPFPEMIVTDPTRLQQILINLIGNSIKFTETGRVHVAVELTETEKPRLCIDIRDTGIGMNPDQANMIFAPFSQADTSITRRFGGTGLGLTISSRMAELLGGKLTMEGTAEGKGTHMRLEIDPGIIHEDMITEGELSSRLEEIANEPVVNVSSAPDVHGHFLLVEDGKVNQELIKRLLERAGATVDLADNGKIGVEKALIPGADYDIILLDMQMPVMDGYTAAQKLREAGYRGPIIALTADAMTSNRTKCLEAGCDDFATKPIDRNRLFQILHHFLPEPAKL